MRTPVIIRCRLVPKDYCVNILGTIWTRDTSWIDRYMVNHERIHTAQQKEMLFIFFYVAYVMELLWRFLQHRNWKKAYMSVSFEREAYGHSKDLGYLKRRRHYAWCRKA